MLAVAAAAIEQQSSSNGAAVIEQPPSSLSTEGMTPPSPLLQRSDAAPTTSTNIETPQLSERSHRSSVVSSRKPSSVSNISRNGNLHHHHHYGCCEYARGGRHSHTPREVLIPAEVEVPSLGFGIGVSGGRDNPHFVANGDNTIVADSSIVVTDVLAQGPASGLLQVNDRVVIVNGVDLQDADYATAVQLMREASDELAMIVKRRVPVPLLEFEQRTLKFTLSKSRKKDDFGIVLGCKFYIKEIANPRLAEKEPGLKEGDAVLRINGSALDGLTLDEATRLLQRSREKLSLVVQRDIRRDPMAAESRWPSQTTVYEKLGSLTATPRHSPTPANCSPAHASAHFDTARRQLHHDTAVKRYSDPAAASSYAMQHPLVHSHPAYSMYASPSNGAAMTIVAPRAASMTPTGCPSPHLVSGASAASTGGHGQHVGSRSPLPPSHTPTVNRTHAHHQHASGNQRATPRTLEIRFRKPTHDGSLGIRIVGGNSVGIFVSAVQHDSAAAHHGLQIGDRLIEVNNRLMNGLTREEAVEHLLALGPDVCIKMERCFDDYLQLKHHQTGDSFFVRTHFAHQRRANRLEITFMPGDILHVTDTLFNGAVGYYNATKVYAASSDSGGELRAGLDATGIIPNAQSADTLAKQARMDSSTIGRSLFRKHLQSRRTKSLTSNVDDDGAAFDTPLPAYERVVLRQIAFRRPVVLYGPLADVARQLLLANFGPYFAAVGDEEAAAGLPVRLETVSRVIDSNKHCLLNITASSVERLQLAQFAPIVILVDVDSRNRIRELRSKAGATTASARRLLDQAAKLKKSHAHLLTGEYKLLLSCVHAELLATLDALKEDAWFDALRLLIVHLQQRRVWIPENVNININDIVLQPLIGGDTEDGQSTRGGGGAAATPSPVPVPMRGSSMAPTSGYSRAAHSTNMLHSQPNTNSIVRPSRAQDPTYYDDVNQLLAEYNSDSTVGQSQTTVATASAQRRYLGNGANSKPTITATSSPSSTAAASNSPTKSTTAVSPSNRARQQPPLAGAESNGDTSNGSTTALRAAVESAFLDAPFIDGNINMTRFNSTSASENTPAGARRDEFGVIEHVHALLDKNGGSLRCPDSGIELRVPSGAIPTGRQDLYLKLCRSSTNADASASSSAGPLIIFGPQDFCFATPAELRLPHPTTKTSTRDGDTANQSNFSLKSGSGSTLRDVELVSAPVANDRFISVFVQRL